jgi:hypothetical protein
LKKMERLDMKFLIESAEHDDGITSVVLRFGDVSVSGFEVADKGVINFPENLVIPFELQDDIRRKLIYAHVQTKKEGN